MLDKTVEQTRVKAVTRRFAATLTDLGFEKTSGASCERTVGGHTWRVWLQKYRHQPAFRVAMSFAPSGTEETAVEFADKWTCRDSPAGRAFDFSVRGKEDAADRCLQEIRDFVQIVAIPWFQARAAERGR